MKTYLSYLVLFTALPSLSMAQELAASPSPAPVATPSAELITEPKAEAPSGDALIFDSGQDLARSAANLEPPLPAGDGGEALPAGGESAPLRSPDSLTATPMGSAVVGLINKLAEKGIIPPEEAKAMVAQAQAEAEAQLAQAHADIFTIAQIAATQVIAEQEVAKAAAHGPLDASREEMRVNYIPAPVRMELKDDIKRELASEGIGGSGEYKLPPNWPAWVSKVKPSGEIRIRYESDIYPTNNDSTGAFPNFNAINTGAPFDVTGNEFAPQWNTDQNRTRFRLLARLGLGIDLGENFTAGMRMATGQNNSPVSGNQSMGLPYQGQGGNFSAYAIWLDRAWLRFDLGGGEDQGVMTFWAGRFDNPFFSTPLIFDDDLGFDGTAVRLAYNYRNVIMPSVIAGAFPVFNTDLNFSSNQPEKYPSYDKYLFAVQGGVEANLTRNWNAQVAAAYYYFYNVEGKLSTPYTPLTQSDAGDTDNSRPSFAQKGNTYMPLRQIIPDYSNDFGAINQWQYFGLATPFQNLALTGRLNYDGFQPIRVSLVGEFVRNLAFDKNQIDQYAVNNRADIVASDTDLDTAEYGPFDGSADAWLIDLVIGHAELDRRWAWQTTFGYRWIGSDAVVDGFNDSEFGLGGTNMKGFTVGGRLALSPNVYLALRWFGSESIAGPPFDMNIFQIDLGAKF